VQALIDKARTLIEALPYISRFRGRTVVVKIGGAALEELELRQRFVEDVVLLHWVGVRIIVVHGGGKQISAMLDRVGLTPEFLNGLRVTDESALEIVEMVLGGKINKELVRLVDILGGQAVGITGKDGRLAKAARITEPDLGLVGELITVDPTVVDQLEGFVPIIAPLAIDESGQTLNVNADTFASKLAVALKAEKLVLLSDVVGVQDAQGNLISTIHDKQAQSLIEEGTISGGMIPKIQNALQALASGVHKVHIINGRLEHSLLLEIFTNDGVGTQVIHQGDSNADE